MRDGVEILAEAGPEDLQVPALPLLAGVRQAQIVLSTLIDGEVLWPLMPAEGINGTSGRLWKVRCVQLQSFLISPAFQPEAMSAIWWVLLYCMGQGLICWLWLQEALRSLTLLMMTSGVLLMVRAVHASPVHILLIA